MAGEVRGARSRFVWTKDDVKVLKRTTKKRGADKKQPVTFSKVLDERLSKGGR